ncbi:hypothetical protein ACP70R_036866 [Stipagrostis hirtigluma subsp. patula]
MGFTWRRWRYLVVNLLSFAAVATVRVRCQTDSLGFISIDCGIPENAGYVDNKTKISYVSDAGFTDTGVSRNVSAAYLSSRDLARAYLTLRSFPDGDRNCYTFGSLTSGSKYLLRATFMYGEYDGLSKPPIFDVYLGVNLWGTVDLVAETFEILEIIGFSPNDNLQVCLVNKKLGTPIISSLVLRPMKPSLYPDANATQSLVLFGTNRRNMGPTDSHAIVRYPDDPHDRVWFPYGGAPEFTEVSTTSPVRNLVEDLFEPPSAVMQTAITPVNSSRIDYSWRPSPGGVNRFLVVLFFSEVAPLPANATREFNVVLNGRLFLKDPPTTFTPDVLASSVVYGIARGFPEYNITLNATQRSTLPPILNALEVYTIVPAAQMATDNNDVKRHSGHQGKVSGEEELGRRSVRSKSLCLGWSGLFLRCSEPGKGHKKLSKIGLTGVIISSFADFKALQYLDLSQNDLSGPIPDFLEKLSSLVYLDLSGNKLDQSIPAGLLKRSQEGSLTLRIGNSCNNGSTCEPRKKRNNIAIIASVIVVVVIVVVAITVALFMCKKGSPKAMSVRAIENDSNDGGRSLQFDNQKFSRRDLKRITNNFCNEIGKGGFGCVYAGQLENGTAVAVKMLNKSSSQGIEEFIAEVRTLIRVHHKSLVSMIGYCKDRKSLALVFEFMSGGALQGRLRGRESKDKPLTWLQRLSIALKSAQGLEYLHNQCEPRLIHRDVKTANILLSENLEAKIADFGLSKDFHIDKTHVSTRVVGTPGYLDPEYYTSYMLTEKSDVFSFGIVLLELVTGKSPIIEASDNGHILQWVKERVVTGNIESIADPNMNSEYDMNSLWKVTEIALKCTAQLSSQRPAMTDVVVQLKESLELAITSSETVQQSYLGISGQLPRMDYFQAEAGYDSSNNILETECRGPVAADHGPGAR